LANFHGKSDGLIFILALFTTVAFQITSNFANDYGDGVKGTDNESRIGPKRAFQSKLLTGNELKAGIIISIITSCILVAAVLYVSFGKEDLEYILLFASLGLISIWAAIKYTVGNSAYGYKGLGDIFVFVFFGLVAVLGSMFLYTKTIYWTALLPAGSCGFLSTGVLNLNNLRDYETDSKAGKNTLVVRMGFEKGKKYHYFLLFMAFICLLVFMALTNTIWYHYASLIAFIPIFRHMAKVRRTSNVAQLDPELKKLALSTFLLALLFYISYNNFL
jgi:1,4-dihydroxy-2-naphthoate octaprenyltransferase